MMNIDGIGEFELNRTYGWYYGPLFSIAGFDEHVFKFILDDYEPKDAQDYAAAMIAIQKISKSEIDQSNEHLFKYYRNTIDMVGDDGEIPNIETENEVWKHIQLGKEIHFSKRDSDNKIYASIECSCDWEEEHGLQIVLKEGKKITKVGPYDGHLSNADSYDDESLEDVIYK